MEEQYMLQAGCRERELQDQQAPRQQVTLTFKNTQQCQSWAGVIIPHASFLTLLTMMKELSKGTL